MRQTGRHREMIQTSSGAILRGFFLLRTAFRTMGITMQKHGNNHSDTLCRTANKRITSPTPPDKWADKWAELLRTGKITGGKLRINGRINGKSYSLRAGLLSRGEGKAR